MRIDTFISNMPEFLWLEKHKEGWQFGEQSVIDGLVQYLGMKSGTCVEIGAGDGLKLPLTCERLYDAGWRTICYEMDAYSRSLLKHRFPNADIRGAWNIPDAIVEHKSLELNRLTEHFDIAVIDIDSNEPAILRHIAAAKCASIVVCEHFDKAFVDEEKSMYGVQRKLLGTRHECGAVIQENSNGLCDHICFHGYERIGWTRVNTFFVRTELCTKLT